MQAQDGQQSGIGVADNASAVPLPSCNLIACMQHVAASVLTKAQLREGKAAHGVQAVNGAKELAVLPLTAKLEDRACVRQRLMKHGTHTALMTHAHPLCNTMA